MSTATRVVSELRIVGVCRCAVRRDEEHKAQAVAEPHQRPPSMGESEKSLEIPVADLNKDEELVGQELVVHVVV